MALYNPTGDVAVEYVAVDPNLVRCGRVWNKDTYWAGDLAVDYGDVDLYLVGCDRVWRFISLLVTL